MTELTSAQCDAFMENHHFVVCGCYGENFFVLWEIYHSFTNEIKNNLSDFDTRQSAITAYWRKYHPDWQPPEIHDAEWAWEYMKEHGLALGYDENNSRWAVHEWGTGSEWVHRDDCPVATIEEWKAKFDLILQSLDDTIDESEEEND